ncbi:hypothetical protein [Pantoea sp. A4]|uniref:hypothetical protein n=1 Tax=Pantoea sp. A4 TaxID=1225184 RepID=UPI00036E9BF9|nr:hypothetical protein [Pantoea sp. A4]
MTSLAQEARHSVVELHQLIEQIFNHSNDSDAMSLFLSHFHPEFTMVTPQGAALNFNDTEALFRRLQGAREGMRIATCEHRLISSHEKEVTVQYREIQMMNGESHSRIAVAVLDFSSRVPRWRYLQETRVV